MNQASCSRCVRWHTRGGASRDRLSAMKTTSWPTRPVSPAELRERVHQLGLGAFADALVRLGRPSIRLTPQSAAEPESVVMRLGGRPLLPPETPWPMTDDDRPLSFIAQLDCAALAPLAPGEPVPSGGLLSFFYDGVEQQAWGFDPLESDCWDVVYTPSLRGCVLRGFPDDLDDTGRYEPMALRAEVEWTPPPRESFDVEALGIPRPWETYAAALGEPDSDPLTHRFLGQPDPIQGDMQHVCQLASNGISCGADYTTDPHALALLSCSSQWRLLLQVDSQEDIGMMWGDVGRLYWWIRDDDLRNGEWDDSWFVLQCC